MHPNTTHNVEIPEAEGLIIAANKDHKVLLPDGRVGIICHNSWVGVGDGSHHQVSLDFVSSHSHAMDASAAAISIVRRVFGG
jgi:hypothetical protein